MIYRIDILDFMPVKHTHIPRHPSHPSHMIYLMPVTHDYLMDIPDFNIKLQAHQTYGKDNIRGDLVFYSIFEPMDLLCSYLMEILCVPNSY